MNSSRSTEEQIVQIENYIERYPAIAPALTRLLGEFASYPIDVDMDDVVACFRLHVRHPELGEALLAFLWGVQEHGIGLPVPLDDRSPDPGLFAAHLMAPMKM